MMRRFLKSSGKLVSQATKVATSSLEKSGVLGGVAGGGRLTLGVPDAEGEALDQALRGYEQACGGLLTALEGLDGAWAEVARLTQAVGSAAAATWGAPAAAAFAAPAEPLGRPLHLPAMSQLVQLSEEIQQARALWRRREECVRSRDHFAKKFVQWQTRPPCEDQQRKVFHYEERLQSTGQEIDEVTLEIKQSIQHFDQVHASILTSVLKGFAEENQHRLANDPFGPCLAYLTNLAAAPPERTFLQLHPQAPDAVNPPHHVPYGPHNGPHNPPRPGSYSLHNPPPPPSSRPYPGPPPLHHQSSSSADFAASAPLMHYSASLPYRPARPPQPSPSSAPPALEPAGYPSFPGGGSGGGPATGPPAPSSSTAPPSAPAGYPSFSGGGGGGGPTTGPPAPSSPAPPPSAPASYPSPPGSEADGRPPPSSYPPTPGPDDDPLAMATAPTAPYNEFEAAYPTTAFYDSGGPYPSVKPPSPPTPPTPPKGPPANPPPPPRRRNSHGPLHDLEKRLERLNMPRPHQVAH